MMTPQRLVAELNEVAKYLGLNNFKLLDGVTPHPLFKAPVVTHTGRTHGLELHLSGFPESSPDMCVPEALRMKDGRLMTISSEMHCLGIRDGKTYICHNKIWRPETSLFNLYIKGKLWLEGYENHLITGEPIAKYLKDAWSESRLL